MSKKLPYESGMSFEAEAHNYAALIKGFLKWFVISVLVGLFVGLVGVGFHHALSFATEFRTENRVIIFAMPVAGVLIVSLYKLLGMSNDPGTNCIIKGARGEEKVSLRLAPLIFAATFLTHLTGGSAGREGAALQLGGSIGYRFGKIFRLGEKDMHLVVLLGMSAVFAALFGTPLTATVFVLEVISVGVIYYAGLVPCIISSVVAYNVSLFFGITPVRFLTVAMQPATASVMLKTVVIAILCALVSILFCTAIKKCEHYSEKLLHNNYVRALVGGGIIVLLTVVLRTTDYNGAGMDVITNAINGQARPEAFILKIIFTAITIAAGFKGGEIVPTFFIGSTFGCVAGSLLGLNPGFGAAIGFVALFCGVVNCPLASIMLALEVFGADSILVFALACGVSFMMSGYYGLYGSQKIVYSKLEAKYINISTK